MGDILSMVEYLECRGGCSVPWGITIHVGNIISTMRRGCSALHSTIGRYHDTCVGDVQYPTFITISLHGTHDILHGTEHTLFGVSLITF